MGTTKNEKSKQLFRSQTIDTFLRDYLFSHTNNYKKKLPQKKKQTSINLFISHIY